MCINLMMLLALIVPANAQLFGTINSEYFIFINGASGDEKYTFEAFDEVKTGEVGYGEYAKGALSTSGETEFVFQSQSDQITESVTVEAGNSLFIALHNTQGESPPEVVVGSFSDEAFEFSKDSGNAFIMMVNLVQRRNVQLFVDGSFAHKLNLHATDEDPLFVPGSVLEENFNSVIEVYDSTVSSDYQLVVRGRMALEKKKVYACFVLGDPDNQESFPYTLILARHPESYATHQKPTLTTLTLFVMLSFIFI